MKYREHRGDLNSSMETVIEITLPNPPNNA